MSRPTIRDLIQDHADAHPERAEHMLADAFRIVSIEFALLEARQRDYGMHDPWCPARQAEVYQQRAAAAGYDVAYAVRECSCWLSDQDPKVQS